MSLNYSIGKRVRRNFGKIKSPPMPHLIEIQKKSYNDNFLQLNYTAKERKDKGLQLAFKSIFPITNYNGTATLEFIEYSLKEPQYEHMECKENDEQYASLIKAMLRLIIWDIDPDTNSKTVKSIKEQEVLIGELLRMTENGTFIMNGTERVVISQMHRAPGLFFTHDQGKVHSSGKLLYSARVIPNRGHWLDLEFDGNDLIYCRIDKRRKMYVTTLLLALGMSPKEILDFYYEKVHYKKLDKGWSKKFDIKDIKARKLFFDLIDADTNKVLLEAGKKLTPRLAKNLVENEGVKNVLISDDELIDNVIACDIFDNNGECLFPIATIITENVLKTLEKNKITEFKCLLFIPGCNRYIADTLFMDKNKNQENALIEIFKILRPGENLSINSCKIYLKNLFFNKERYDLSALGRIKLNSKLGIKIPEDNYLLTPDDIKYLLKTFVAVKDGFGKIDNIDHLGNRRVRLVGELVENQILVGLKRIQKSVLEKMAIVDLDAVMPHDLINPKLLTGVLREFFGTSPLSQFMDQTNPLAEITHQRRLSALGPGGVNKERAGLDVRDIHPTHYGKICPIGTPEGQGIGLVNALATYVKINQFGLMETPYRKVKNRHLTDEIVYLSAIEEDKHKIAQSNVNVNSNNKLIDDFVYCRYKEDFIFASSKEINFVDINPMQVFSVSASLIPFLENDDAIRALMGSNMQRQAVPLIKSSAPFVGTGIEKAVAIDSGSTVIAQYSGVVISVDSNKIVIHNQDECDEEFTVYNLLKFRRSNHNTCINQTPLVNINDSVRKGDVIADGVSTEKGEIALGKNVLVAFLSWNGYTIEDSVVVSKRLVKNDVYTSISISVLEIISKDTRLGPEEITRDIPNVSEYNLRHLDECGIVNIGAKVSGGDVLVGKVTPKTQISPTSEEKLLRAIFGEKSVPVSDSSLYVPSGVSGTVIDIKIFSRRDLPKDDRTLAIEQEKISKLNQDKKEHLNLLNKLIYRELGNLLLDKTAITGPEGIKLGIKITQKLLEKHKESKWWDFVIDDENIVHDINQIKARYQIAKDKINLDFDTKVEKIQSNYEMAQGVLKLVKVFLACKHKLQPGDKMSGRQGDKGVISNVVAEEEMPFLEDGTPVDLVLNPLGVISRMNIGQILEVHLGLASAHLSKKIAKMIADYNDNLETIKNIKYFINQIYEKDEIQGKIDKMSDSEILDFANNLKESVYFASPVFDGAKISDIKRMLKLSGTDESGQIMLRDGKTGEFFDRKITVGYKYFLKLHHIADEKVHARSVGPYSLVTQQPLGGKVRLGGQRLGEMEVWALLAYGAAYTLQEMLTVKSDDINGRVQVYESIIRNSNDFKYHRPESFNVMVNELRSLCLNVSLVNYKEK